MKKLTLLMSAILVSSTSYAGLTRTGPIPSHSCDLII